MRRFGAHSDWSKFEMERSDWSCAYCRQGRHGIIPYYRSNEEILGHFLIGREQFQRYRSICVDGSDWSRAVT